MSSTVLRGRLKDFDFEIVRYLQDCATGIEDIFNRGSISSTLKAQILHMKAFFLVTFWL